MKDNHIWFVRAFLYYNRCKDDYEFKDEFNFIGRQIGLLRR